MGKLKLINKRVRNTLKNVVSFQGIGVMSGEKVQLTLHPQEKPSGIVFSRTDKQTALIPALANHVLDASARCTVLGTKDAYISTIEHLLSALKALEIDDVLIEVEGPELPIMDGSSKEFVQELKSQSIQKQAQTRDRFAVIEPFYYQSGGTSISILPSPVSAYTAVIHYPQNPLIGTQIYEHISGAKSYIEDIAPCRTFCLYEEIEGMKKQGLIKGGSLDIAVVIQGEGVLTPGGVRFEDEMVRHKVLDLIGDLSLSGYDFLGQVIAIRPGHHHNVALAAQLQRAEIED